MLKNSVNGRLFGAFADEGAAGIRFLPFAYSIERRGLPFLARHQHHNMAPVGRAIGSAPFGVTWFRLEQFRSNGLIEMAGAEVQRPFGIIGVIEKPAAVFSRTCRWLYLSNSNS